LKVHCAALVSVSCIQFGGSGGGRDDRKRAKNGIVATAPGGWRSNGDPTGNHRGWIIVKRRSRTWIDQSQIIARYPWPKRPMALPSGIEPLSPP
jgi:hypothetical protein